MKCFVRRAIGGVLAPLLFGACVGEPEPLSICEERELKLELCGLTEEPCPGDAGACTCSDQELDDRSRCELRCALEATCEDFEVSPAGVPVIGASEDLRACLAECRGEGGFEFRCDDGQIISADWLCDGTPDCDDGSDEIACA